MIIVDTCVLSDIVTNDDKWLDWSVSILNEQYHGGEQLIINPIIFTEFSIINESLAATHERLKKFRVEILELSDSALFNSGRAFVSYKRRGGSKVNVLPDFFIGAHAESLDIPIITRDKGRFTTYFPKVKLITP